MDLQDIQAVSGRLAASFGIRPPEVVSGWVPRSMRLGVRARLWRGRRLRLVIGPAAKNLEPDELEGELASAMAAFTLRRGFLAQFFITFGTAVACEFVLRSLVANFNRSLGDYLFIGFTALWIVLLIALYRNFIYRSDRKVVEVLGAGPLFAALDAERRLSSNGLAQLWSLPHPDRRAERAVPRPAAETTEDDRVS